MCGTCGCEPDPAPRRLVLQQRLLSRNSLQAELNRAQFRANRVLAVNVLSAPGSGKTALLEQMARLWPMGPLAVIVGDLATERDAQRLQAAGARALQICTGDLCHLDAALVSAARGELGSDDLRLLMIENVGNLVCPAAFDLGEQLRIAILSVTEGEDKPLKYPALFKGADAVVLNKIDLAKAADFDRQLAIANLAAVAPQARLFETSARLQQGLDGLISWLIDELEH